MTKFQEEGNKLDSDALLTADFIMTPFSLTREPVV